MALQATVYNFDILLLEKAGQRMPVEDSYIAPVAQPDNSYDRQ